jgi:hypothetical protein
MSQSTSKHHATRSPVNVRLAAIALGFGLLVVLINHVGPRTVAAQMGRVGPRILWLAVPYAAGTIVGAFPWSLLLPRAAQPPMGALFAGRFAASGANALLPFFGLAGEPSRLLWLAPEHRASGFAAIVIDRVLYNSASALLLLLGALVALTTALPVPLAAGAAGIAIATIVVTVAIAVAAARFGIGVRTQALLARLFGRPGAGTGFGTAVDDALVTLVRGPRGRLCAGLFVHLVGRALLAAEILVALWALDIPVGLTAAIVLAVVPIALSLFVSMIPSQIGVQEGAQALIAAALGLTPALGVSLVLLQRLRQLVFIALTPVLLALARPPQRVPAIGP